MSRKDTGDPSKQRDSVQRPCGEKPGEEAPSRGPCDWSPGTREKLEMCVRACCFIGDAATSERLGCLITAISTVSPMEASVFHKDSLSISLIPAADLSGHGKENDKQQPGTSKPGMNEIQSLPSESLQSSGRQKTMHKSHNQNEADLLEKHLFI